MQPAKSHVEESQVEESTTDSKPRIESLLKAVARQPQSLLMLDYDGTIAPFRRERNQAFPYSGFAAIIEEIARCGRTRVVIISGRDATEVVPLLDVKPRLEIWGLHGLQRLRADGSAEVSALDESTIEALTDAEHWLRCQRLQDVAEFKTGSVAVHWRGSSEEDAELIRERVLLGWKPIAKYTKLNLLEFDGGVEIRSCKTDKGTAVRALLSEMDSETPAAYLGDDTTDESAFQAINGRGLSVLVRPRYRATAAEAWLKPPDDVFDLLQRWLKATSSCPPAGYEKNREKSFAVKA
jgi:trehalose 6-phosphate phosphatase